MYAKKYYLSATCALVLLLPVKAPAYPIDCAILLCLAGGWPASAQCAAAKAEFIRRITPWPVEPPVQVWRCPMGGAQLHEPMTPIPATDARGVEFAPASDVSLVQEPYVPDPIRSLLNQVQLTETADIDISGPDFDFIRSIVVYQINWSKREDENSAGDGVCRSTVQFYRIGSYGTQGDFAWRDALPPDTPSWLPFSWLPGMECDYTGRFRGVAVEWRDHAGTHGFEVVRY